MRCRECPDVGNRNFKQKFNFVAADPQNVYRRYKNEDDDPSGFSLR